MVPSISANIPSSTYINDKANKSFISGKLAKCFAKKSSRQNAAMRHEASMKLRMFGWTAKMHTTQLLGTKIF